jgi:hypothetical protein
MHGQQTMKYLNDKAVADAMMKKDTKNLVNPVFEKAAKEAIEALAKNISQ